MISGPVALDPLYTFTSIVESCKKEVGLDKRSAMKGKRNAQAQPVCILVVFLEELIPSNRETIA